MIVDSITKACTIIVNNKELVVDLILLDMLDFDIILEMDWLVVYATLDCFRNKVIFQILGQPKFCFEGDQTNSSPSTLSTIQGDKRIHKDTKLEDIPIVQDFPEIFPKDLLGLSPDREIKFSINLIPGCASIAKSHYRMAPTELKELKVQLQSC